MSIEKLIERSCVQTIVYWGNPVADGYGGYTYDDPVEIEGRWEEVSEMIATADGEETLTRARVWLTQDVDEGGYMYLGDADELDSNPDPQDVDGAWKIISFRKIPALGSTTKFVRRANLNMAGNRTV